MSNGNKGSRPEAHSESFKNRELGTPSLRASVQNSKQLRIKTLPNEYSGSELVCGPEANALNIEREKRLNIQMSASAEKGSGNKEIEYFELDLKSIIGQNKSQQAKANSSKSMKNQKERLASILDQFLMKLDNLEQGQIQQNCVDELSSHFSRIEEKQGSQLVQLMSLSIKDLKGKVEEASRGSKLTELKGQKSFMDHKYSKFYLKKPHQPLPAHPHPKPRTINDYSLKKLVRTMVDDQGNEFRVTVEKIQ